MKIAIITDQHFGARKGSALFHDYFLKFYNDIFFPTLEKEGITTIVDMGDTFDNRRGIDFLALDWAKENYFNRLRDMNIKVHTIVGNHTAYYKNTNEVNTIQLLLKEYKNIICYDKATEIKLDKLKVLIVPWINKENEAACLGFMEDSDAKIVCGHFELNGYQVMRGVQHSGGLDPVYVKKFDRVFTGHFHQKHERDNVHYFGTAYQMTFNDLFEKKGFHIYDTETDEIEFVENPEQKFFSLQYTDDTDYTMVDFRKFRGSYVKVFVHEKKNAARFDKLIERLYDSRAESVMILENEMQKQESKPVDEGTLATDTLTLIGEQIDDIHSNDKDEAERLKNLFKELYLESFDEN